MFLGICAKGVHEVLVAHLMSGQKLNHGVTGTQQAPVTKLWLDICGGKYQPVPRNTVALIIMKLNNFGTSKIILRNV